MAQIVIEKLTRAHNRASFSCGKSVLDDYLQKSAREHADKNISLTWVARREAEPAHILGYVTTSLSVVAVADMDDEVAKRLPRHPVPFVHLARLATDKAAQGRGVASELIGFVASHTVQIAEFTGCFGIELLAIDDEAHDYYVRRGFLPLQRDMRRLYMPMKTLREGLPPN